MGLRMIICALAACCFCAALFAWPKEYGAFTLQTKATRDWYLASSLSQIDPSLSVEGQYTQLQTCDRVMADLLASLMPQAQREAVAQRCLDLAEATLKTAPSLSLAHLVRAQALLRFGQSIDGADALVASEKLGGKLTWMAARRIDMFLTAYENLSLEQRQSFGRDVARLLASTPADARLLAERYNRAGEAREFIVGTIESLPMAQQKLFIRALRQVGS